MTVTVNSKKKSHTIIKRPVQAGLEKFNTWGVPRFTSVRAEKIYTDKLDQAYVRFNYLN